MSMEATSGKNPINHVGKLYNLLSTEIAKDVVKEVKGIDELYIRILSQIGKPIDQPLMASAQVVPQDGLGKELTSDQKQDMFSIIDKRLANITQITDMVTTGRLTTF
jgi:S-adenosylmethionine synthetase